MTDPGVMRCAYGALRRAGMGEDAHIDAVTGCVRYAPRVGRTIQCARMSEGARILPGFKSPCHQF